MTPKKESKILVTQDERFKNVHSDPRFRMPKRNDFKVEVDDRFSKSDLEAIKKKSKIDKYGRKIKEDNNNADFSKYYKIKDNKKTNEEEPEEEPKEESESDSEADDESQEESEDNDSDEEDSEVEAEPTFSKLDRARGEGISDIESSSDESSSDESSSDEESSNLVESDLENEEEKQEETDPSNRFAVVNLDWDNVTSVDLFATFQSFVPSGGLIKYVSIYPSEFGKERLQREDIEGPPKELFKKKSKRQESDNSDSEIEAKDLYEENDGVEDYDSKSLRKYQLQRLRYYYAVVVCDSIKTAQNIYDNCDGTEYESTANFFDLRFIPDEMEFNDEPRDSCNKIPSNYKPESFVTDALQHSKVKLTWDETPAERIKLSSKAFSQRELDDMDFKAYLASDNSDEEEEVDEDLKSKYKNLVGISTKIGNKDIFTKDQKEHDVDMEITFTPGLDENAAAAENDKNKPKEQEDESSIDKLKRKARERRKQRKDKIKELRHQEIEEKKAAKTANGKKGKKFKEKLDDKSKGELELLMMDENNNNKDKARHFSMKKLVRSEKEKSKKSKHRKKERIIEDDFKVDLNDPRFNEIFTNHDFAIDPSQPQFKKTATMQKILDERNKRRVDEPKEPKKNKISKKRKLRDEQTESSHDTKSLVQKLKRKSTK